MKRGKTIKFKAILAPLRKECKAMIKQFLKHILLRLYGCHKFYFPLPFKGHVDIYAKDKKKALLMFKQYMEKKWRQTA